jgi:hypothetical protein
VATGGGWGGREGRKGREVDNGGVSSDSFFETYQ